MSTTRKVAYNTVAQIAGRVGAMLLALINLKITTKYLGSNTYGSIAAVSSFITLFSTLTDWGLVTIASREIARLPERAEEIIGANVALRFVFSVILVPVVIATGWIAYHNSKPELAGGVAILSLILVFNALQSSITAIFAAKVRNDLTALIEIIGKALSLIGVVIIIKLGLNYYGYLISTVIISVLTVAVAYVFARNFVRIKPVFNLKVWRNLLIVSVPLGLVVVMNTIYFRIDSVLITFFRPTIEVGYYGVAYKIIEIVMAIGGFFMLALMPYLVVSDMARVKQLIQRAFDAMISLAVPILIGSLLLSSQLIVLVSSADYLPATLPFVILMVGGATSFINAIYGNALVALNHQKRLIRLTIVVVSINIIMNLLLIPHIGIVGAAIANSTSEVLSMLYCYYLFTKITKIKTSFIQLPKVVVASIAMVFVFFLIDYFCPHAKGNPMGLIAIIIVLSTVYFGALATVRGFQKDLLKNIMGKS